VAVDGQALNAPRATCGSGLLRFPQLNQVISMSDAVRQEPKGSFEIELVAEKKSWFLAETEGFEYTHFSVGISDFQRSTHVRTHEVVYES
jgi:hypothetical protein